MDSYEPSFVGTAVQSSGMVLVALLCGLLLRTVRRPFLAYWAAGWGAMAVAILALLAFFAAPALRPAALPLYCFAEYGAGLLWLAGCRNLTTDSRLRPHDGLWCLPAAVVAAALPALAGSLNGLLAVHALVMVGLFGSSFGILYARRRQTLGPGTGVMMVALFVLMAEFLQYAPIGAYAHWTGRELRFPHLRYSAFYDLMLEMLLAFGMVMVAMEQVRRELEAANHELRTAGQRLKQLAQCDPLTGALNRHAFAALVRDAEQHGGPFTGCAALLDIDNLKPVNDTLGHAAGDRLIQTVAQAVRAVIRPDDLLFRWGGDEFLVLWLGQMKEGDAALRLERLAEQLPRRLRDGGDEAPFEVGVSFGLAAFADVAGLPAAIDRADERMYARKLGRPGRVKRVAVAGS